MFNAATKSISSRECIDIINEAIFIEIVIYDIHRYKSNLEVEPWIDILQGRF